MMIGVYQYGHQGGNQSAGPGCSAGEKLTAASAPPSPSPGTEGMSLLPGHLGKAESRPPPPQPPLVLPCPVSGAAPS